MTMKRDAWIQATGQFKYAKAGTTKVRSASPSQVAAYGKYLPAEVGAHFQLSLMRDSRNRTRADLIAKKLRERLRQRRTRR